MKSNGSSTLVVLVVVLLELTLSLLVLAANERLPFSDSHFIEITDGSRALNTVRRVGYINGDEHHDFAVNGKRCFIIFGSSKFFKNGNIDLSTHVPDNVVEIVGAEIAYVATAGDVDKVLFLYFNRKKQSQTSQTITHLKRMDSVTCSLQGSRSLDISGSSMVLRRSLRYWI